VVAHVRLHRGASLEFADDGECTLSIGETGGSLGVLPPGVADALRSIEDERVPDGVAAESVMAADGPGGLQRWVMLLRQLEATALLERSITLGPDDLATLRPVGPGPSAPPELFSPSAWYRMSRFALVRPVDGALLGQSPHSHVAVELGSRAAALLAALTDWSEAHVLAQHTGDDHGRVTEKLLTYLLVAGVVERTNDPDAAAEADAMVLWNPFDLWLHARTRGSRIVDGFAGSYPFLGRIPSLPARPERFAGRTVALPEVDGQPTGGPSFYDVLERRISIREHDDEHPITIGQLTALLYHAARTRQVVPNSDDSDELVDRPYPAGGALHELELYAVVRTCDGLEPGMWHYRSDEHLLEHVADPSASTRMLLQEAQSASMMAHEPQVLLVISARFGRLMWKYEAIAYALTLKHVGVLMQNLYLVATDLGLAPCGIGAGDAGTFAGLTGRDFFAEGSVGEFAVGSRPATLVRGDLNDWRLG
jgi:SagB-type dehydrogenase family enzyme